MIISRLSVQSKSRAVLIHAVETAALLKLVPRAAGHGYERTWTVYALNEVLVTADVITSQKSFNS